MRLRKFLSVSRVSSDILKEKQSITLSINKHEKFELTTLWKLVNWTQAFKMIFTLTLYDQLDSDIIFDLLTCSAVYRAILKAVYRFGISNFDPQTLKSVKINSSKNRQITVHVLLEHYFQLFRMPNRINCLKSTIDTLEKHN